MIAWNHYIKVKYEHLLNSLKIEAGNRHTFLSDKDQTVKHSLWRYTYAVCSRTAGMNKWMAVNNYEVQERSTDVLGLCFWKQCWANSKSCSWVASLCNMEFFWKTTTLSWIQEDNELKYQCKRRNLNKSIGAWRTKYDETASLQSPDLNPQEQILGLLSISQECIFEKLIQLIGFFKSEP